MKRTNLTFGVYPDVSLAHARKLRAEAKELPAKNIKEHLWAMNHGVICLIHKFYML
jgi:hypothetical protein